MTDLFRQVPALERLRQDVAALAALVNDKGILDTEPADLREPVGKVMGSANALHQQRDTARLYAGLDEGGKADWLNQECYRLWRTGHVQAGDEEAKQALNDAAAELKRLTGREWKP
jgi:hypothetical protein